MNSTKKSLFCDFFNMLPLHKSEKNKMKKTTKNNDSRVLEEYFMEVMGPGW